MNLFAQPVGLNQSSLFGASQFSLHTYLSAAAVLVCLFAGTAVAQSKVPHYCKTDVGVLGPYPNDGSVHVGDQCYGTASDGTKHSGTAVMGPGHDDKNGVPHYCKTDAGVLGPYPNDGSVHVGDKCYGTASNGTKHQGTAVMGPAGDEGDDSGGSGGNANDNQDGVPHYCKTDVGVLGPYPNDGSVRLGDRCYGTASDGTRHYGTAVMSKGEQ